MPIELVPAKKPYDEDIGDLVCDLVHSKASDYLENDPNLGTEKIIPLCLINPNPWRAVQELDINARPLVAKYKCPYTNYEHFGVVPVALLLFNGGEKSYPKMFNSDFIFDWEWHKKMIRDRASVSPIQKILLGSGYSDFWRASDGHGEIKERKVMLDNGDGLLVAFWEWYNK